MNNFDELMGVLDTLQKTATEAKDVTMQELDTIANTTDQATKDFDAVKQRVDQYFNKIEPTINRLDQILNGKVRISERTVSQQLKGLETQIMNQNYQNILKWAKSIQVYANHNAQLLALAQQNPSNMTSLYYATINNTYAKYMELLDFINSFLGSISAFQELQQRCVMGTTRPTSAMEQGGGSKKAKSSKSGKKQDTNKDAKKTKKDKPKQDKPKPKPSSAKSKKLYKKAPIY